jgi:hypothetical protein
MSFLDRTTQVVNATLTKKGRELLAKGDPNFAIVKFALGDDEIDYSLWNSANPLGSDYYGSLIEMTPILEALSDDTIVMRSKLITLQKGATSTPIIIVSPAVMDLYYGAAGIVTPATLNGGAGYDDVGAGYTCIVSDKSRVTVDAVRTAPRQPSNLTNLPSDLFDDATAANSMYAMGLEFRLNAVKFTDVSTATVLVTLVGNESGVSDAMTLTVHKYVAQGNERE